ncbi:protein MKS1-like [Salvia divinorum]|uniref:Protein MKS1-like n=1 Tax=Salvia divinorum TaxID=28513 RepID=A0ABD1FS22_SALDI
MDMPDFSSGPSPRRELQGPRPAPLKVRKDSHKIRKPPMAPPPAAGHHHPPPHPAPRPPVIIYTVSPKIIHANPNEFMSLVQRLTGPNATSSSSASAFHLEGGGAVSPAARFASIERTKTPEGRKTMQAAGQGTEMVDGIEIDPIIQRSSQFPGILSPNPNALPPIPPNFFNISSDNNNPLNFFHDLSPVLHSSRNFSENSFIFPSPSTNFISPHINTPSPNTLDLFHSLFDL